MSKRNDLSSTTSSQTLAAHYQRAKTDKPSPKLIPLNTGQRSLEMMIVVLLEIAKKKFELPEYVHPDVVLYSDQALDFSFSYIINTDSPRTKSLVKQARSSLDNFFDLAESCCDENSRIYKESATIHARNKRALYDFLTNLATHPSLEILHPHNIQIVPCSSVDQENQSNIFEKFCSVVSSAGKNWGDKDFLKNAPEANFRSLSEYKALALAVSAHYPLQYSFSHILSVLAHEEGTSYRSAGGPEYGIISGIH